MGSFHLALGLASFEKLSFDLSGVSYSAVHRLTDIAVEFWIDELLCTLAKVLQMKVFTKKDQIIIIVPTDILSHNYIVLFLT